MKDMMGEGIAIWVWITNLLEIVSSGTTYPSGFYPSARLAVPKIDGPATDIVALGLLVQVPLVLVLRR